MNTKQTVFVAEYLKCWNASEAARRAGYSVIGARLQGTRMLALPEVQEIIKAEIEKRKVSILDLPIQSKNKPSYVYLIQAENGLVKIGIASDVNTRFITLNIASPVKLELLFSIQRDDARQVETTLHNLFKDKRIKGEWFSLDESDLNFIKQNYGIE